MGEGLAEWIVTAPDGQQMMLQMAYFDRTAQPVTMDVGPVLDLEDVVGGKVCALASRVEPRDYIDTAAALRRYTVDERSASPGGWIPAWRTATSPTPAAAAGPVGRRDVHPLRAQPGGRGRAA